LNYNDILAGACGNRTHPACLWQATPDLKSGRNTRILDAPKSYKIMANVKAQITNQF
jgi:hypothetical protein